MADLDNSSSTRSSTGTKFANMTFGQKLVFTAKFIVFLVTLGFAFANVMDE